jgi:hypothetical protein
MLFIPRFIGFADQRVRGLFPAPRTDLPGVGVEFMCGPTTSGFISINDGDGNAAHNALRLQQRVGA